MAIGEAQLIFEPERRKIDSILQSSYSWPDYKRWETWKRGALSFFRMLWWIIFGLGTFKTMGAWFLICFFAALFLAIFFTDRQRIVGLLVAALLAVAMVLFLRKPSEAPPRPFCELRYWLYSLGFVCFSVVLGDLGGRAAGVFKERLRVAFTAILLLGIVVATWGCFSQPGAKGICGEFLLGVPVSISMKYGSVAVGAIFGIVGAFGLCSVWRRSPQIRAGR